VLTTSTAVPAIAQEPGPDLQLFAGARVTWDSNFFRVEEESQKPDEVTESGLDDLIFRLYGGGEFNRRLGSRSSIQLLGEVGQNAHNTFSPADNTSGNLLARWFYSGDATDFSVGFQQIDERVDFINQNRPRIDFRTRQEITASATRRLTSRWSVRGTANFADIEFERNIPVERAKGTVELRYESRLENSIALVGEYQERSSSFDNLRGFEEVLIGPELDWRLAAQLRVTAELKFQQREPQDAQLTEFDGTTGEFMLEWAPSEYIGYAAGAYRRVSALGDQLANFAVTDGVTLRGDWQTGGKLDVYAALNYERRDFALEPVLLPIGPAVAREDDLTILTAGAEWRPTQKLAVDLRASLGDRSSNRALQDFRYESVGVGIRWNFL